MHVFYYFIWFINASHQVYLHLPGHLNRYLWETRYLTYLFLFDIIYCISTRVVMWYYNFFSYPISSFLISPYVILPYFILINFTLSYLILSYLILSYLILSYLILSHLILSYLILSHLILSYLTHPTLQHLRTQGRVLGTIVDSISRPSLAS